MSGRNRAKNRAKDQRIGKTGVLLTNNRSAMVRVECGEGRVETGGIGKTAMLLTNTNAIHAGRALRTPYCLLRRPLLIPNP
jgi:hypothetical protein